MAVPTVHLDGDFFESGRMSLEEILAKLGSGPDAQNSLIRIHSMF